MKEQKKLGDKEISMPRGEGTYGSQRGRPSKKKKRSKGYKKGGAVKRGKKRK